MDFICKMEFGREVRPRGFARKMSRGETLGAEMLRYLGNKNIRNQAKNLYSKNVIYHAKKVYIQKEGNPLKSLIDVDIGKGG